MKTVLLFLLLSILSFPVGIFAADGEDIQVKPYDGPYNHPEIGTDKAAPVLRINGTPVSPIADDLSDVLISVCDGPQEWKLLKEYSNWKDVNRFGFYNDLGIGNNQTLLFEGYRNEGYSVVTTIASGTQLGLFLHNDTDNDSVFSGYDSYLYSERSLTVGSGANEHQWFMVYDVSSYKGTGATYAFDCNTEDYSTTGDFDYLIYIDDNHTSANFDHNDMILGITCESDATDDCGNVIPGIPPNYFGVDTSYFIGEPALPIPPPDSGGVYIWVDTLTGLWTIATHIYSKGNSLEQFHGSIVVQLDSPPELGVNVFMDNFELWEDTVANRCLFQNDRWGWSLWDSTLGLYEIWWDVTTREYLAGAGDLNDFLIIQLYGTAIDFNVWSSGHAGSFNDMEIYLGENMTPLGSVPGFWDYGGFDVIDQYQAAVGSDPANDPNTSVFSNHCGIGESYNAYGLIDSSDSYVCDGMYGENFAGSWVYQADGIQFSVIGLGDPCLANTPPVCNLPPSATYFVCGDTTFNFVITVDDIDENAIGCTMLSGPGTFTDSIWTFTTNGPGTYTADFECSDFCGEYCGGSVSITVEYNTPPVCNLPANGTYSVTGDSTFSFPVTATDSDGNLVGCSMISGDGTFDGTDWTFTTSGAGVYTATFECIDECNETCSGTVEITVGYNLPPQTTTPPQDTTVLCCVVPGDITVGGFAVSDPDGNLDYVTADPGTYDNGEVTFFVDTTGTYTITLIAVDTEGLADTSVVDIVVNVNQPPVATCFGSKNDTTIFVCDIQDEICLTGFSCDDPDGNLSGCTAVGGTLNGDEICFTPQAGTNTLMLIAEDDCGIADTCITTVYVIPNSAPTVTCPGDQDMLVCDLSPITIGGFVCDDPDGNLSSCSVSTGTISGGDVTFTPVTGINEIILTAVDDCGKTKACTTLVTVTLNSAPTVSCPSDQTIDACNLDPITIDGFSCDDIDGNLASCSVDNGTLTGTSVTFTPIAGANVITLTATDDCGETATCQTTITVNLNNPPTASCPGDQMLEVCSLDPITISGFACDDPDGNLASCSVDNGTLSGSDVTFTPVAGANVITLTATDDCGETATCQTTITVNLNNPPTASCPGDQNLFVCDLSPITLDGFVCDDPDGNLATCSVDNGTLTGTSVTFTPVMGANSVTLTAVDDCGETASCTVNINIAMNNPPTVSCPSTQNLFVCDLSPLTVSGFACDDPDGNLANCSVDNGTLSGSDVTFTPVAGVNTITLTATDDCGETATCQVTVNVTLNNSPTASCPSDQTIDACNLDPITIDGFSCDDIDGNLASCSVDNGTLTGTSVTFTPVQGANVITLTATDDCGETATCQVTINVTLNNPPTASCPGDQALEICNLDPITISGFACDDPDGNLASCSVDNGTLAGSDVTFTPVAGVNTITLTATDDCGETATCQTTITVNLNNPPTASCPGDQNLFVCDLSPITLDGFICDDPDGNLATCSVDNGTLTGTSVTFTPVMGANSVTLTAVDDCGETASCTVNINVAMNNPPTVSCPSTQNLFVCDLSPLTVSGFVCDDPDGNLANCSVDNGTLSGSDVTFTPVVGVNTITLTATDDCGETATCQVTVNVTLNSAPTVSCPSDQTIDACNLDPITIDGFSCDDIDGNLASCSVDNGTLTGTSVTFTPVQGANVITLTATDDCGETATCITTITVNANEPPDVTCPGDEDLFVCDFSPITLDGFVCDDPEGSLVSCSVDNGTLAGTSVTFTPVAGVNTITLTAEDNCGNTASCVTTVNVTVNSAPTASCPSDYSVTVCDLSPITLDGFVCDDVDGNLTSCSVDNGTLNVTAVTFTPVFGVNIITLTAVDACGEVNSCMTTITVTGNTPPAVYCPDNVTLEVCDLSEICLDGFVAEDIDGNLFDVSVDNGTLNGTTVCFTPVEGENVIGLTAIDACDEEAACITTVTVVVNDPPVVQVPADQELFVCDLDPTTLNGFTCSDPDGNLASCEVNNGTLGGSSVTFTPTAGANSITLTATDECGETAAATVNVNVNLNSSPTVTCPNDTTLYLFELTEICLGPFTCDDADGNLATCDITGGNLIGDNICLDPVEGNNVITVTATDDCGAEVTCETNVEVVLVSYCPMVTIEKVEKVIQGEYQDVSVTISNAQYEMGGLDLLIAYDASALTFIQASQTGFLDNCDWEYFTYRNGASGNCDGACPSGMIRVVAFAEYNDGVNHPDCFIPADAGEYGLFDMRFFVSNNRTFECQYVPIYFFWYDCGDNAIASKTGDTTFIDRTIYNFEGEIIWDETDDYGYPESQRQASLGAPDLCLNNPDPDKPTALRCIDFTNGGIDIVCADSIDARGDINLNGISNEISDAVVLTNYFIAGLNAFKINIDGQTAASDANADGIPLSVADLVYIIRVITGDAVPYDKLTPDEEMARFHVDGGVLITDAEIGAAHIVLEGAVNVEAGVGVSHIDMKTGFHDENTHVLLYSFDKGTSFSGELLRSAGRVLSIEAVDYLGNNYRIGNLPSEFALTSYPNPFNPSTNIDLTIPTAMAWTIEIYNINGQRVAEFSGHNEAGKVSVTWDADGMSTGIYFVKARAGAYAATKKLVLLK